MVVILSGGSGGGGRAAAAAVAYVARVMAVFMINSDANKGTRARTNPKHDAVSLLLMDSSESNGR